MVKFTFGDWDLYSEVTDNNVNSFMERWSLTVCYNDLLQYPNQPWSRAGLSRNRRLPLDVAIQDVRCSHPEWVDRWNYTDLCQTHGFLSTMTGLRLPFLTTWSRSWLSFIVRSLREVDEIDKRGRSPVSCFTSCLQLSDDIAEVGDENPSFPMLPLEASFSSVSRLPSEPSFIITGEWDFARLSERLPFSEIVGHPDLQWRTKVLIKNPGFIWELLLVTDPRTIFSNLVGEWDWIENTLLAPKEFIKKNPDLPWRWDKLSRRGAEHIDLDLVTMCEQKVSRNDCLYSELLSRGLSVEELGTFDKPQRINRCWLSENTKIPIKVLIDSEGAQIACQRQVKGLRKVRGWIDRKALLRRATFLELPLLQGWFQWNETDIVKKARMADVYRLWDQELRGSWTLNETVMVDGVRFEDLCRLHGRKRSFLWKPRDQRERNGHHDDPKGFREKACRWNDVTIGFSA